MVNKIDFNSQFSTSYEDYLKKKDIEEIIKKVGFNIEKFMKLIHADFWVLSKK